MILQLAWRNIWRNKRRTLITMAAVAFAVFLVAFMVAFQKGVWDSVIDGTVNQFFGYAQIHGKGYWEDQSIDNSIELDEALRSLPQKADLVADVVPRIESFALASEGNLTAGVMVIGIDPQKENEMTGIANKITEGHFLHAADHAVVVAAGLAKKLKLTLNDTLVLISQGYHGYNAAGKYPIKGIFEMALPDLNKRLLYLPLKTAQNFYAAEGRVTTLALKINDRKKVPAALAQVKQQLPSIDEYEVMDWQALMPELVQARKADEGGGYITLGILYLLIAFAIFGTILMMTKERSYEFGVLTAIGMGRWKLFFMVWLETIMIAISGAIVGILMTIPLVYYFHIHPLDVSVMGEEAAIAYEKFGIQSTLPTAFELPIFFNQAFIIFIVTSILALYPFVKIMRLKPVAAMRA